MKRNEQNFNLTKAEKYLINDLYILIISSASDPVEMMKMLSRTLREFIGAEEIILFECAPGPEKRCQMISQVNTNEKNRNHFLRMARELKVSERDIVQYDISDSGVPEEVLGAVGYDDVMIVPVLAGETKIGCMHVYGSLDKSIQDQLERLMTSIRPLVGVILQNYQLYNNMDILLKERTKVLDQVNRELANLIYTVPDLIVITDRDLVIHNMFNYDVETYYFKPAREGVHFSHLVTEEQLADKKRWIRSLADGDMTTFMEEVIRNGRVNHLENRVKRYGDRFLHIIRNISDLVTAERQVDFMHKYDQLTGLYNRGMFYEILDGHRRGKMPIGVLLVDMNGLKLLNETLGFGKGDKYLKLLSRVCETVLPAGGDLSRVGDDEIAFILPDSTPEVMNQVIHDLGAEVEKLNRTSLKKFPLSISQGYFIDEDGDKDHEYIFTMAEKNLNQDKLLHAESKKSAIVRTLAKALEARDFITEGHADRMEDLLEIFGNKMKVDGSMMVRLRLFGKFHDIGKVGIADSILFKPDRLSDDEMTEMKKHSEIGYRIALTAADLHAVADLILKHHERYDGSGYPIGLAGDDIPLECRILAIVDAFDAMTNNRPYRDAMSQEDAVKELERHKGGQFDPLLVEFFIHKVLELKDKKA